MFNFLKVSQLYQTEKGGWAREISSKGSRASFLLSPNLSYKKLCKIQLQNGLLRNAFTLWLETEIVPSLHLSFFQYTCRSAEQSLHTIAEHLYYNKKEDNQYYIILIHVAIRKMNLWRFLLSVCIAWIEKRYFIGSR